MRQQSWSWGLPRQLSVPWDIPQAWPPRTAAAHPEVHKVVQDPLLHEHPVVLAPRQPCIPPWLVSRACARAAAFPRGREV